MLPQVNDISAAGSGEAFQEDVPQPCRASCRPGPGAARGRRCSARSWCGWKVPSVAEVRLNTLVTVKIQ